MYSKQVILDVIDTLPNNYDPLEAFLIRFDLDEKINTASLSTSKIKIAITKYLISNQGIKDQFGNDIVHLIVEERLNNYLIKYEFDEETNSFNSYPNLYKYLRYDGYDIINEKLVRTLPEDIGASNKEDEIKKILSKYGFDTTIGHWGNAKSSYFNSNLAATTSQLRTYVESLFLDMAKYIKRVDVNCIDIISITPQNAITAMQLLSKCSKPILDSSLNEWDGGNKKTFIEGFWNRLHPQGSHPGLPDLEESLFRFQLVLLVTFNLIKRFESSYK